MHGLAALLLAIVLVFGGAAAAFAVGGVGGAGGAGEGGSGTGAAVPDVQRAAIGGGGPLAAAPVALGANGEPGQSEGGSVMGILLDNTPAHLDPDAPDVSDSYLGILLAPGAGELVSVTYMLTAGVEYTRDSVAPGWQAARPRDPAWPSDRPWPEGFQGEPVFNGWCTDTSGTSPYDFSQPVLADLVLWAAWADGGRDAVKVTLDAGEGGVVADLAHPDASPGRTLDLWLRPGAMYPALPTPVKEGWEFVGWFDVAEGGNQVYPTPEGAEAMRVPDGGCTLYAHWAAKVYWVHYVIDAGAGTTYDQRVPYDQNATTKFMEWDALLALGYVAPQGKKLLGWHTDPAGNDDAGTFYEAGNALPDLKQAASSGSLDVYAQWQDEYGDEEYAVRFVLDGGQLADGSSADVEYEGVALGAVLEPFSDPKRPGYQFGGWWLRANDDPDGAFVRRWEFAEAVHSDLVLYARWDLRLDVTVPVSLAFAVDASTRTATAPEPDRYAIKSRTVAPVHIEAFELKSSQADLEEFFERAEGGSWDGGIAETRLSLKSEHAASALVLALAGERKVLASERRGWTLAAFSYGGPAVDDAWQGADPSERLRVAFDLAISDQLEVKVGQAGAVPIARLEVTVSSQS